MPLVTPKKLILPPGNKSGLTVTAKVYDQTGTQVGATVSLSEEGSTSIYRGEMPTASQGVYFVEFKDSFDNHLGTYEMNWDGNDEVTVFDTASTSDLADLETKIDTVDSNVDAVLVDTGTNIPSQISGVPSDVMSSAVESGFNVVNTLKILLSVLAGKIQGSSSGDDTFRTEVFRSVTDDRDVLTSKTNSDGERVEIQIHG